MKAKLVRTGKNMSLSSPQFFFAQDRSVADEAFAGDVVGIPNHGTAGSATRSPRARILRSVGVPSFAPEIVRRVRLTDAMKRKKLKEALQQMSEKASCRCSAARRPPALVGVVGPLQLDVLKARSTAEYSLPVNFEVSEFQTGALDFVRRPQEAGTFIAANGPGRRRRRWRSGVFGQERVLLGYTKEPRRRALSSPASRREEEGVGRRHLSSPGLTYEIFTHLVGVSSREACLERLQPLHHDDGSWFAVVAGPSAKSRAHPTGVRQRPFGMGFFCFSVLPRGFGKSLQRRLILGSSASSNGRRAAPSRSRTSCST